MDPPRRSSEKHVLLSTPGVGCWDQQEILEAVKTSTWTQVFQIVLIQWQNDILYKVGPYQSLGL